MSVAIRVSSHRRLAPAWLRWLAVLAVLWLGFGLRVYRADHQEFWGDEGAKVEVVNQDLAHLFDPRSEVHPRFFHAFLFVWYRLFGLNLFGLRLLPALFGVLGLPLIYVLARRLFDSRPAGLAAATLLALSPFHVAYSQDITMYTLLFAMLALSFYRLWRVLAQPRAGWGAWAAYALATALLVHTHYYAVFALAAQNIYVLWRHRGRLGAWLAVQGAIAAGTLPWLYLQYRVLAGQAVDQVQDVSLANLGRILQQGALGFTVGSAFPAEYAWVGWLYVVLVLMALARLLRRPATRAPGLLLGLWLLVPPLLVWVFDIWLQHFGERFVSMSLPPLLLLLAWGATRLPGRNAGLAALLGVYALTSGAALRAWYYDPAQLKSEYGAMMALVARRAQPGDVLLLNGPQQAMLFQMYQPAGLPHRFISPDSVLTAEAAERDFPQLVEGYSRAWLVLHGVPETYDPGHQAEAWLARHGYKADYQSFLGGYVTLYVLGQGGAQPLAAMAAEFAGGPRLTGVALDPPAVSAGETLFVTLQWEARAPMSADYTVFVHVVDAAGQLAAQTDSQPASGTRPTSAWVPGEVILDRYAVLLPEALPAGEYSVRAGLYEWPANQRLALMEPRGEPNGPDYLFLGTIRVTP